MQNFWYPIILLIVAIIILLFIFIRRLSDLVLVDVNTIPEEKTKQLKDKLLAERLERRLFGVFSVFFSFFHKIYSVIAKFFSKIYKHIELWEKSYRLRYKPVVKADDMKEQIQILLNKAYDALDKDEFEEAERTFLEVISHDKHNVNAYKGLGRLYYRQKEYQQSKEILDYAIKLLLDRKEKGKLDLDDSDIAQLYYYLSLVYKSLDLMDKSLEYLEEAVNYEENNPKYLNAIIDQAIEMERKYIAKKYYEKLKEVNPDNLRLPDLQEKISELKDSIPVEKADKQEEGK